MSPRTNSESHNECIETEPSGPSLLQSIVASVVSQYRRLCEPSPKRRQRHGYRPGIEQLEDRRMLSVVPLDFSGALLPPPDIGPLYAEVCTVDLSTQDLQAETQSEISAVLGTPSEADALDPAAVDAVFSEPITEKAAALQSQYKFRINGQIYFNEHRMGEKEFWSDSLNNWVIILPNGDIHTPGGEYPLLTKSDPLFFDDPTLLFNAEENLAALRTVLPTDESEHNQQCVSGTQETVSSQNVQQDPLLQKAAALQSEYQFRIKGQIYFNEHGRNEKEFWSDARASWVIILPNGDIHEPGGDYPFLTASDPAFYEDPTLLFNAEEHVATLPEESPAQGGDLLRMTQAQVAVSAELTAQLEEEVVILEEELTAESQQLLTSVHVRNQELSRIQGIQLFQRSDFYIHGNNIEPILQQNLPHIFPENLQAYIEEQAVLLNEEPGHIQDRILMQQSDYRGILRGLVGSYETVMSDLLNKSVDMAARVQADPSVEHDLMQDLRTSRDTVAGLRYMTEVAFFGVEIPTAEALYREGKRLFGQEHDLLTKIQSEQDRLQTIDNFRASNRAWQLAHGVPDLSVLIGADEGSADNGYQGELSEAQQRRLGRAQRLVETAMSSMLDRRIQMRIVPEEVPIENRLVYDGNGVTYLDVHATEQETVVQGVMDTLAAGVGDREGVESSIVHGSASLLNSLPKTQVQGMSTLVLSDSVELAAGTNELSRWWATAGEAPIDIDWSVHVDHQGIFRLHVRGFETWDLSGATLVIDGVHEVELDQDVSGMHSAQTLDLQAGGHTFTLRQAGVPAEVGVHPGRFTLVKLDELSPIVEADMETLLIADHPEIDLNQTFTVEVDGTVMELHGVQELIEKFTPSLRFSAGENFPMPYDIDQYVAQADGNLYAEIDISESPAMPTPTTYASVVQDGNRLAINYHFFYPMSNWGDEEGYNTHEGDWEGVTVYLNKSGENWQKGGIALAQHEKIGTAKGGQYFEDWDGIEGTHPTVFVGLGGHASYLNPDIYHVTPIHDEVVDGSGNIVWHEKVNTVYLPRIGSGNSELHSLLRFPGLWGAEDLEGAKIINNYDGDRAPQGPVFTSNGYELGLRWLDPFMWGERFK